MTKQEFKSIVTQIQKFQDECAKLAYMKIHIFNAPIFESVVGAFFELFECHFGEENRETLEWFLFNAEEGDCTIDQLYDIIVLKKDYKKQNVECDSEKLDKISSEDILKIFKQLNTNGKF